MQLLLVHQDSCKWKYKVTVPLLRVKLETCYWKAVERLRKRAVFVANITGEQYFGTYKPQLRSSFSSRFSCCSKVTAYFTTKLGVTPTNF